MTLWLRNVSLFSVNSSDYWTKKKGCKNLWDSGDPGSVQPFRSLLPGGFTSPSMDRSDRTDGGWQSRGEQRGKRWSSALACAREHRRSSGGQSSALLNLSQSRGSALTSVFPAEPQSAGCVSKMQKNKRLNFKIQLLLRLQVRCSREACRIKAWIPQSMLVLPKIRWHARQLQEKHFKPFFFTDPQKSFHISRKAKRKRTNWQLFLAALMALHPSAGSCIIFLTVVETSTSADAWHVGKLMFDWSFKSPQEKRRGAFSGFLLWC